MTLPNSILYEIKNDYKIAALIFGVGVFFAVGLELRDGIFESPILFFGALIVIPAIVSVSCFIVGNLYDGSKIFGRSYFLLGFGFFFTFVTELVYVYYGDLLNQEVPIFADVFLMLFYFFVIAHLIINIRYFSQKLYNYQKFLLIIIPTVIILGYMILFSENEILYDKYVIFNITFVSLSSITVGLSIVGFTLFRHTALVAAWLLILVALVIGTIGDLEYFYFDALQHEWLENHSLIFWISSNLLMTYALYRHQKAI